MILVADESVAGPIVERLRADGHTILSIRETTPSIPDDQVLARSIAEAAGSADERRGLVDRWILLAEAEPDSRQRADYGGLAQVFADRVGRKDLWHDKLKGWNVTESSVVNEWIAEGEAKGEAKGVRASVVSLGTKKFGRRPTEEQRTALDAISDLAVLTQLNERLLDVNSWDELLRNS